MKSTIHFQYSDITDGGVYQCRASNAHGAASFNIYHTIVEPPTPPMDVRVESVTSRTASVSWRDAGRTSVQYYSLQHTPNQPAVWTQATTLNVTRHDGSIRQTLDLLDLRPATSYGVRVASGNQADLSPYTTPFHFTTLEEAPSAAPTNIQVVQTENPGELSVSWLPPPKETHNGVLIGYHVKASPQSYGNADNGDVKIIKTTHQTGKQQTMLSGLLKNERYAILISASTSAGPGPFSLPVYQETREGAPEQAPASVECVAVSSTSLRVGWQPVALRGQGSSVIGYTILYAAEEGTWQNSTSLHTELYVQGLLKYTNYTIKVAGFSNYGVGPFSNPIVCATLEDVPGPPADIKLLVASSTSLLVSWKKPIHPNGQILGYNIYTMLASSTSPSPPRYVPADTHSVELGALPPRPHTVWVTARGVAGEGTASPRRQLTPSPKVPAGIASLGDTVSVGAGSSVLLQCQCVGAPPPRAVWYHRHNVITHHPRFTRNHDDSLFINNVDQSLSGNYTCLAKNLYGSDSVDYTVVVLPLPEAPMLHATPNRNSILVKWDQPNYSLNSSLSRKMSYSLTWKEQNGPWQEAWTSTGLPNFLGAQSHTLRDLKCGTKYSLRITATNKVGTSQPAYLDVTTLGGVAIPPSTASWLWSNSTHIHVPLSAWDDGGCDVSRWDVHFRPLGATNWMRAETRLPYTETEIWHVPHFLGSSPATGTISIAGLTPATWYQVRVTATNEAGVATSVFNFATKSEDGDEIGPPLEIMDPNVMVIVFSSILLAGCLLSCIYILIKRQRSGNFTDYHGSSTVNKSESGNLTANTSHTNLAPVKESSMHDQSQCGRVYTAPVHHVRSRSKHELYEISPYAQFAVGFRTFGHVDNQDPPSRLARQKYDTETSFQACSESEDSDSISKSTLKSVPRKPCRTPHRR